MTAPGLTSPRVRRLILPILASIILMASVTWAQIAHSRLDASLLEAIAAHRTQDAIALIERGADPNATGMFPTCGTEPAPWTWSYCCEWIARRRRHEDEKSALILAAENGEIALVEKLLSTGADINSQDGKGRTALIWAATSRHTGLVRLLIDRGADVFHKDAHGWTAHLAAEGSGDDAALAMLERAEQISDVR